MSDNLYVSDEIGGLQSEQINEERSRHNITALNCNHGSTKRCL